MRVHIKPAASHRSVEFIVADAVSTVPGWFKIEPDSTRGTIRTSPSHDAFRGRPSDAPVFVELVAVARNYLSRGLDQNQAEHAFEDVLTAWSRAQELAIRNVLTGLERPNEP